jgi:pimeloyl-ACP methyl ester carboxylesterase
VRIDVNGVGIEVAVDGPEDGPAVLLLHGWPDSHALWRNQVPALVDAGYRVIAPDQRGFGASDRPTEVADYGIPYIVGDAVGVLDHLGVERAHVIGHDWGAAIAWAMAGFVSDRVDRLVALSVGHPSSFRAAGFEQREKSWYMLLFQFPGIAEQWLSADDFANFRSWGRHPDADDVIARLREEGALTAGLNWYRANLPPEALLVGLEFPPITAPAMGVWSTDEFALTEQSMTGSERFVSGPWRYERVEGAGHWIMLDRPDRVNELLLDFLGSAVSAAA